MTANRSEPATAIVLAGGKSTRMGADKSLLPLLGKPLIQHVCEQLAPHFDELLIAGGDDKQLAFLGVPVIPDEVPGQGPLRAIASALAASANDLNFIVACDTPRINGALVTKLIQQSPGFDCVVPITSQGHYEPLFAVYRKSALPAIRRALETGERRITAALKQMRTKTVPIPPSEEIVNINTMDDYQRLTLD